MNSCGADVKILTAPLPITIGDGIPLGLPLTFIDAETGDPYEVDVAGVTATIGEMDLTVSQAAPDTITVSASALDLAAIKGVKTWTFAVGGVPWLTGTFRVTTSPGCSSTGEAVVVNTSPEPVHVHVGSAALAGQVAALTARIDALEAVAVIHTPTGG